MVEVVRPGAPSAPREDVEDTVLRTAPVAPVVWREVEDWPVLTRETAEDVEPGSKLGVGFLGRG